MDLVQAPTFGPVMPELREPHPTKVMSLRLLGKRGLTRPVTAVVTVMQTLKYKLNLIKIVLNGLNQYKL